MVIAIDFDGTCVTHEYPKVGKDIGAVPVLKELAENGHQLILWTMRSHDRADDTDPLQDAVNWFAENEIPLYGINTNPAQKVWTASPKAYAQLYIDDAALGCPLVHSTFENSVIIERSYVDWIAVRKILISMGVIKLNMANAFLLNQ